MANPTSSTTIARPDLGAVAWEYAMAAASRGYIGLQILPLFSVSEPSGEYPVIPTEAFFKLPETKRAPRGAYARGDWEFENANYSCQEYGWEEPVDDVERKLYRRFFDSEKMAVMRATDVILRGQEKRIKDAVFNTSNFTAHDVTNEWDDADNADPAGDVKIAKKTIKEATGVEPNALIIPKSVFDNVMLCSAITDVLKYTDPVLVKGFQAKKALLAQILEIPNILVGDAMYDTKGKGVATSLSNIWGTEYGMVCRIATGGDLREPSIGRTFIWDADSPGNTVVESYREEQTRSDIYRVRHYLGENFIMKSAAYLLGNLTT